MHRCETIKYQIAVFIIFLLISSGCFAYDFAGGTGEPNDPYQIETAAQLLQIGSDPNLLDKCFILNNDIDLDPNVTGIPPFTQAPIAPDITQTFAFYTGTFDGNDNIISSLIIDTNGVDNSYLGLFGGLWEGCIIKNLGIENFNITVGDDSYLLGGLCGHNEYGTIIDCFSSGSVNGGESSYLLGGLCGSNSGTITSCYSTGLVTVGTYSYVFGGLCGSNSGTISNCFLTGSVVGGDYSEYLGGLCGRNSGTIINCHAKVVITAGDNSRSLGGLLGDSFSDSGMIKNCYATGSVSGGYSSRYLGGLCGYNHKGIISNCFSSVSVNGNVNSSNLGGLCGYIYDCTIINCFSTGFVVGGSGSDYLGGLCGSNCIGTISNCYSTGQVDGDDHQGGFCGRNIEGTINKCYFLDTAGPDNGLGTPLTDTQMKQQASFIPWDFVNETDNGAQDIWTIKEGIKYPEHVWPLVQYHGWDGVDLKDYSFFSNHWMITDCNDVNDCNSTDLDFSSSVDNDDLDIFTTYWLFAK